MNNTLQTPQISNIVQELNKACTFITDADLQKEAARLRAISAAKDLIAKLEHPAETILQHATSVRMIDHFLFIVWACFLGPSLLTGFKGSRPCMRQTSYSTWHLPHSDKEEWAPN